MEWPQVVMIVLYSLNVGTALILDGVPKAGKYSVVGSAIGCGFGAWILHMGGFWS